MGGVRVDTLTACLKMYEQALMACRTRKVAPPPPVLIRGQFTAGQFHPMIGEIWEARRRRRITVGRRAEREGGGGQGGTR